MAHPTATETTPLITPETHIIESQNRSSRIEPDAIDRIRRERSLDSPALKTAATMFSFFILGLFIASTGVMLPHLMSHYSISDLEVSTLFLVMPAGYILAASSNSFLHSRFGQRGVAVLGPLLHIISAVAVAFKPRSFAAIVAGWGIMALGTGLLDASWCAHAASQPNANKISGFLHGSFSAGAAVGPFVVGSLMAKGVQWSTWYWVLAAASLVELVVLSLAFRHSSASAYRNTKLASALLPTMPLSQTPMITHPAVWISALYFLTYVGNETAISGWIVTFMTRARHVSPYLSSISSSGYWAGMAVGRLTLGHFTDQMGARQGATVYLSCAIVLQLFFAIVQSPIPSIVIISLLGFFMGPLFPSGVVVLMQLLPRDMHINAVSFISSIGQVGGAALPFGIGAVVQTLGIGVFRWVLLVFSLISLGVWCVFTSLTPKSERSGETNEGRDYIAEALEQ